MSVRYTCAALAALLTLPLAAAAQQAQPATVTLEQFRGLRFIEGSWIGSGYAPGPFYERYVFVNDSTIEMTSYEDAAFTRRSGEVNTYQLRGGKVTSRDGKGALMRIDSLGYHFASVGGSGRWTFRRVSADRWTATLGPQTVYTMDRVNR